VFVTHLDRKLDTASYTGVEVDLGQPTSYEGRFIFATNAVAAGECADSTFVSSVPISGISFVRADTIPPHLVGIEWSATVAIGPVVANELIEARVYNLRSLDANTTGTCNVESIYANHLKSDLFNTQEWGVRITLRNESSGATTLPFQEFILVLYS
jgi:hypothetical protein